MNEGREGKSGESGEIEKISSFPNIFPDQRTKGGNRNIDNYLDDDHNDLKDNNDVDHGLLHINNQNGAICISDSILLNYIFSCVHFFDYFSTNSN